MTLIRVSLILLIFAAYAHGEGGSTAGGGGLGGKPAEIALGEFPESPLVRSIFGSSKLGWEYMDGQAIWKLMNYKQNRADSDQIIVELVLKSVLLKPNNFSSSERLDAGRWWVDYYNARQPERMKRPSDCADAIRNSNIADAQKFCEFENARISLSKAGSTLDKLLVDKGASFEQTRVGGVPYMKMSWVHLQMIFQLAVSRLAPAGTPMQLINEERDYLIQLGFRRLLLSKDGIAREQREDIARLWIQSMMNRVRSPLREEGACAEAIMQANAELGDKTCGFENFQFKSILRPEAIRYR